MRAYSGTIVTAIPLPPDNLPASVAKAARTFEKIADQFAEAQSKAAKAAELIEAAKVEDNQRVAGEVLAGRKPVDLTTAADEAARQVNEADAMLSAISLALDTAGNNLAGEIAKAQSSWKAKADEEAEAALAGYRDAVAQLRPALNRLGVARGTAEWLDRFQDGIWLVRHDLDNRYHGPESIFIAPPPHTTLDRPDFAEKLVGLLEDAPASIRIDEQGRRMVEQDRSTISDGNSTISKSREALPS